MSNETALKKFCDKVDKIIETKEQNETMVCKDGVCELRTEAKNPDEKVWFPEI